MIYRSAILSGLMLGSFCLLNPPGVLGSSQSTGPSDAKQQSTGQTMAHHPYVGMWVTHDGQIRHELLPNGRYDEARGSRKSAYRGRYEVSGNHIDYWDDTGFTADGEFVDRNTLHHGGMIFRRH